MRSPSLHPTSSTQRCPSGHPARYATNPEFIEVPPLGFKCELCSDRDAKYVCRLCKRKVCEDHFDPALRICAICKAALCTVCNTNLSVGHCAICGRIVCPRCSIDVDGVRRVCYFCLVGSRSISLLSKAVK